MCDLNGMMSRVMYAACWWRVLMDESWLTLVDQKVNSHRADSSFVKPFSSPAISVKVGEAWDIFGDADLLERESSGIRCKLTAAA